MMVIPINYEVYKTQYITKEDWAQLSEVGKFVSGWGMNSKNHDRDDDGEYCIAKCLKAIWGGSAGSVGHMAKVAFMYQQWIAPLLD